MARHPEKKHRRRSSRPTARQLLGRIILIMLAVAVICAMPATVNRVKQWYADKKKPAPVIDIDPKDGDKEPLVRTEAEIMDVVLGKCRETGNFVVCERDVSVDAELSQAFLGWSVFRKTKSYTIKGTGFYAVDLTQVQIDKVDVNVLKKQINITVPEAFLLAVEPDYDKTTFNDTERGLLAFGDVKLTPEQQNEVEAEIMSKLKEELGSVNAIFYVNQTANDMCKQLFTSIMDELEPGYRVMIRVGF